MLSLQVRRRFIQTAPVRRLSPGVYALGFTYGLIVRQETPNGDRWLYFASKGIGGYAPKRDLAVKALRNLLCSLEVFE